MLFVVTRPVITCTRKQPPVTTLEGGLVGPSCQHGAALLVCLYTCHNQFAACRVVVSFFTTARTPRQTGRESKAHAHCLALK
jgi:hypothetical protein